jgi:DNA replication protein DnaC
LRARSCLRWAAIGAYRGLPAFAFALHGRQRLLEILDDSFNARSTLVTSQLPIAHWHEYLGDPTLADAILDRLVHRAYKLNLTGESLRKMTADLTHEPALA